MKTGTPLKILKLRTTNKRNTGKNKDRTNEDRKRTQKKVNRAGCMVLQVPVPLSLEDFPGLPFMPNRGRKTPKHRIIQVCYLMC